MSGLRFDVVVVGAGPGGAAAAKCCVEQGLKTLLLEKRVLPREKVCSGLLLGRMAHEGVASLFGRVPDEVILERLSGIKLWLPAVGEAVVPADIPVAWRKDLDHWMVRQAAEAGAEVLDGSLFRGLDSADDAMVLDVRSAGVRRRIRTRFLVGADGAYSSVRRGLFPQLQAATSAALRECYRGSTPLDKNYVSVVFPLGAYRPNGWVTPHGDRFTIEGGLRDVRSDLVSLLVRAGWSEETPLFRDGVVSRVQLFDALLDGSFVPAKGNALLVGDAAGLKIHLSGEGIGTALKSGAAAADAIATVSRRGGDLSRAYSEALRPLLRTLEGPYRKIADIGSRRGRPLLRALQQGFAETLELS